MKLRNKETGGIVDFLSEVTHDRIILRRRVGTTETPNIYRYNSLAELNADWEDYDEKAEKEAVEYLEQILDLLNKILEKGRL